MLSGVFSVCDVRLVVTVELQEPVGNDNHVHGTLHVGMLVSDVTTSMSGMETGAGETYEKGSVGKD